MLTPHQKHLQLLELEDIATRTLKSLLKTKGIDLEKDTQVKLALERLITTKHQRLIYQGK